MDLRGKGEGQGVERKEGREKRQEIKGRKGS